MSRQQRRDAERARRKLAKSHQKANKKHRKRAHRRPPWLKEIDDPREKELQELKHQMSVEIRSSPASDGVLAAPIGIIANYVTDFLIEKYELDPDKHPALKEMVRFQLGEKIREMDTAGFIQVFNNWQAACRDRDIELVSLGENLGSEIDANR